MLLQEFLVLTAEIPFEHNPFDFAALDAEPLLDFSLLAKQLRVVPQFTGAAEPCMERLTVVVPVAATRLEHVPAAFREHRGAFRCIGINHADQPLVAQMLQRVVMWIGDGIPGVLQVTFRNDPKRSDRCEHPGVFAVQFVRFSRSS